MGNIMIWFCYIVKKVCFAMLQIKDVYLKEKVNIFDFSNAIEITMYIIYTNIF